MIIPVAPKLTDEQLEEVRGIAAEFGVTIQPAPGAERTIYAIIGDETDRLLLNRIDGLPYISQVRQIQEPYKVLSLEHKENFRHHTINGKRLGEDFVVMAGHCAIDPKNPSLFLETAHAVKEAGADVIRGGVWKPRTSPYSFQGDDSSLQTLMQAKAETGLQVITEVMDEEQVQKAVDAGVDMLQVGARNALNYKLLRQIGQYTEGKDVLVLLKRSIHPGKVEEFILAAEYIAGSGNPNVMLCPRGTLPTMDGYRNQPDEAITQLLKEKTWAPVIVDPSHSVGKAKYVPRAAMAAAAYGADGVIIETHCKPVQGIGDDPKQAVSPDELKKLIGKLNVISNL